MVNRNRKRVVASILLFSDSHYSINSLLSEEKWFPPVCAVLEKILLGRLAEKFLRFWDQTTQRAFTRMIDLIPFYGPYTNVFGLGDYTPGTNESGMVTGKARMQFFSFIRKLGCRIHCPDILVWGDHDAGYRFSAGKIIGTEQGGLSEKSVATASELIGPPFGSIEIGSARFIYISTNLVRNVDNNSSWKLRKLKIAQESFLANQLNNAKNKLVFLLLHDPTALGKETAVRKIIDSHRKKVTAIIHGHLHAEFSRCLTMLSPVYWGLCREYKAILVPASWGVMGIGGGFKVLSIGQDGSYHFEKHSL